MASFLILLSAGVLAFGLSRIPDSGLVPDPEEQFEKLGNVQRKKGQIREQFKTAFVRELDGDSVDFMGAYFREGVERDRDQDDLSSNPGPLQNLGRAPREINYFPVLI